MNFELWLAFLVASVLISISPGAGAVNSISTGLRYGVAKSMPAILGLQIGYGAHFVLVAIGVGAFLASSVILFEIIKWLGICYLIWLGYKKWTQPLLSVAQAEGNVESNQRQFWQAALVNLTNPKSIVFLLALLPQFIDPEQSNFALQMVIMGTTLVVVDIVVMIGYAGLASQLSRWMKDERHQVLQNRIFGGVFVGAAVLMASYKRTA